MRCLDALERSRVAVERADLAHATALLAARYENVLADAFYPQIVELLGTRSSLKWSEVLLDRLRSALTAVRSDMRGVAAMDAHLSDPDALEEDIDSMAASLRSLLDYEDAEIFKLIDELNPKETRLLRQRIEEASAHQTSLPDPPDNPLIRKLAEISERIRLTVNDQSTAWHPGLEAMLDSSQ